MEADTGMMTRVLDTITGVLSQGTEALGTEAAGLLSVLIAIEITWAGLMWALGPGHNFFRQYLKKVIKVGIFGFLTLNFATVANVIKDGFVWAGVELGGGEMSMAVMQDPSAIVEMGFEATGVVWTDMATSGALTSGFISNLIIALVGIAVLVLYFVVALQVFITLVEFYLVAAFGVIMVPWGVNKHTAFIAERYFGAILAQGVKLMVVVSLVSILVPIVSELSLEANPTFTEMMTLCFGMATVAFLIWRAPNVASGLMAGSANLSANDAAGMAMGGAMMGKTAAVGAASAGAVAASGGAAAPAGAAATAAVGGAGKAKDAAKGAAGVVSDDGGK